MELIIRRQKMYKALHLQTQEEIVILSPAWRKRLKQLRELDHADLLVCQGCMQPLRVKAGEVKRPHFAHKHLKACSYGSESPDILNARAVLYEWLLRQFGEQVTVEKQIEGERLPRPVDCWVETRAGVFAYWIIESGIRLEPREQLKTTFEHMGVKICWIFLNSMLHEEKKEFHSLLLTPTERAYLQPTVYDEMQTASDDTGSLYYLDAENRVLTTYRALRVFHKPNWFRGHKKTASLEEIRANMQDGTFVYPGESAKLNRYRKRKTRLEQKRGQYESQQRRSPQDSQSEQHRTGWGDFSNALDRIEQGEPPLQCISCGKITSDYWSTFFAEDGQKYCRCRECLNKGL